MTIPPSRFLSATRKGKVVSAADAQEVPDRCRYHQGYNRRPGGNLTMEWESLSIKKELTFLDFGQV